MAFIYFAMFLALSGLVSGNPTGAPESACNGMTPGHGFTPRSDSPNYTITLSSGSYRCGGSITVTLGGDRNFKGFFCQARTSADNSNTRVGMFEITDSGNQQLRCNEQGITHTNRNLKSTTSFTWKPSDNHGNLYIVCTWVQQTDTYWVRQPSSLLMYQEGGDCGSNGTSRMTSAFFGVVFSCLALIFIL